MVAAREISICPRCSDRLYELRYEPTCLRCGYVDYSIDIRPSYRHDSVITSAALAILPYIGDSPHMAGRVVKSRAKRRGYRVAYILTCPFCELEMERGERQGHMDRDRDEQRYLCRQGHRVNTLTYGGDRRKGWR